MSDPKQYYILMGDKQQGPYTFDQLTRLLEQDDIYSQAPCAAAGDAQWSTVAAVVGWDKTQAGAQPKRQAYLEQAEMRNLLFFIFIIIFLAGGWAWWAMRAPARAGKAAIAHIMGLIPGDDEKCRVLDIEEDRYEYTVRIEVDGKNAMGGWVRKKAEVRLSKPGFTVLDSKLEN